MVLRNCYKSQEKGRQDDKVDIKWEESFIACSESDIIEEILKKHLWNPETPKKYAWRQYVRQYLTTIEKILHCNLAINVVE